MNSFQFQWTLDQDGVTLDLLAKPASTSKREIDFSLSNEASYHSILSRAIFYNVMNRPLVTLAVDITFFDSSILFLIKGCLD